jgi:hypothetical protein
MGGVAAEMHRRETRSRSIRTVGANALVGSKARVGPEEVFVGEEKSDMGKLPFRSVAVLAGVISFATPASADRGLPRRYSADAFFSVTSECTQTSVGVFPVAFKDRNTGQVVGASMNMQVEQVDVCTDSVLLQGTTGVVVLLPGQFAMSPGLNKASLHADVTLHDAVSGRDLPLSVSLSYRAVEPRSDSCTELVSADETTTFCDAVVEGVVSDGKTNLTSDPGKAVFQEHRPL